MFYYSKKSRNKIIHMRGCHYIRNTDDEKLGTYKSIAAAYREGYYPCRHCSEILKLYRKEKKKVPQYKKDNYIGIRLFPRYIEFKTSCSEWRVIPSPIEGETQLYHKNYYPKGSDFRSEIPGFHDQRVKRQSLKDYIDYIIKHDKDKAKEKKKPNPNAGLPKKVKGRSHKKYCRQVKALKKQQRKQRIRELWLALECLAVS